jgi:hypothetical protein
MKNFTLTIAVSLLLVSCANPTVVPPLSTAQQKNLTCEQIQQEVTSAQHYEKEARSEDRFKAGYILIAPAVVSIYRMDQAEKAARTRLEQLEQAAAEKNCGR